MSTRLAAVVLALFLPIAAPAQDRYTDHPERIADAPVAVIVDELVEVVNAADGPRFLALLERRAAPAFRTFAPDEQHVGALREFCRETRGVEYYGYRTYDPPRPANEHVAILRGRLTESWWAFVLVMDGEDPTRFAGLQFAPARRPSTLAPLPPLAPAAFAPDLDAFVDRLVAADGFSGTILVAKDGETIYERASGEASKSFHVPNDMDTKFNLGSMNKMFTAVAIGRLVEEGKLSLDAPLRDHADESWLAPEVSERIRIRHLLNHTSGLGSYFNDTFWDSSRLKFRALDDYKPLVREESLAFEPGTGWQYSNTAFLLLGVVIERVTGRSYFDHVRETIFIPAGMTSTDSYEMDAPVENLAIGYVPELGDAGTVRWRNNLYLHVVKGSPAGGGYSTARDLLRFDRALRAGLILSAPMRDELWRPRPDEGSPDYGYGFAVTETALGRVVGHGGGFPGLNGQLDMYLDAGYTVIVLSNYDRGASPVATAIAQRLERLAGR